MKKNIIVLAIGVIAFLIILGICRVVMLKDAADPVVQAILNIGEVTIDDEEAITKAQEKYDNLPNAAKAYVKNYDDLDKARQTICIELISQLEEDVSEENIERAEEYYNTLSEENKEKITNLHILDDAKDILAKRKEQAATIEALQIFKSLAGY